MSTPPAERLHGRHDRRTKLATYVPDQADLSAVARAVGAVTVDWTVELSQVFADEANLIIMPENGDDAAGPTFVIYYDDGLFCVDQVHWDDCTSIGQYENLGAAIQVMVLHLAHYAGVQPTGALLH
ncbi:MAG: hypothetical protein AB7O80_08845 [Acetobacteraceae bacterium]